MSYVCVIYELLILLRMNFKSPFLSEDKKKATELIASVVKILTSVICTSLAAIFATKQNSTSEVEMLLNIFYVCGELTLTAMSGSKYSYQRNTYSCSSSIYLYKRKKGVSDDTNYKRKNGCQYQLTNLLYRVFFYLSALFLNFFISYF